MTGELGDAALDVIDAHVHVWDPVRQRMPWLDAADSRLNRRFTLGELAACYRPFARLGVRFVGAVYVEIDCDDPLQEDRLIAADGDRRWLAKVMRADVCAGSAMRVPLLAAGVRDPLHVPSSEVGRCLADGFIAGLEALGRAELPFDACVRRGELADLAEAHERSPQTVIVLDHMGNVTPATFDGEYRRVMQRLAAVPTTYLKVSGYPTADRGFVRELLAFSRETFGDRRMYASNWPVVESYATFAEHLETLLDEEGVNKTLFADAAARVYGIGDADRARAARIEETSGIGETGGIGAVGEAGTINHIDDDSEESCELILKACSALLSR
ncbi:amidohydrolase family protein [Bifidobacterium jacchi]|uniref:Amidohydrolase n=1 Tax=Bifidobacterium jacchi TaxID=2490545 RepID=A0A5N5RKR9_9BIFI|nr:amidohydrolase family protein [Bifidobacterium jacchi]KAB5607916.1 amidohydrolase [Bifidobacterium jacchi]